jgi:kynurenine formamidase
LEFNAHNIPGGKMRKVLLYSALSVFLILVIYVNDVVSEKNRMEIEDVIDFLHSKTFVDLTHSFSPSIPIPNGMPKPKRESIYEGAVQIFTHVGQYGTHLDAPGHFHKGMRLVDSIPIHEFVLKGCLIDISKQSSENHDYQLQLDDVKDWEKENGLIPQGAIVILRTDWSQRWYDPKSFFNKDENGQKHYPGWGREPLEYLIEKRKIRAIAHETPDTDSGMSCGVDKGWPLESYVLEKNLWQIENLNNADKLPYRNFLVFVGVPKGENATGFPVRVFAILP